MKLALPINNDSAIIQSHYPHSVTISSSLPSAVSGSLTDLNSHSAQLGLPGSNFQWALPLYQPGGNIGSWGAPPPAPSANRNGLTMPMHWQGYYGAPSGIPNLHQQSLFRPPPGLTMPSSMQQQRQYPNFNPPYHHRQTATFHRQVTGNRHFLQSTATLSPPTAPPTATTLRHHYPRKIRIDLSVGLW